MFDNYPDILTTKQVCDMLSIGKNNAYNLIRFGEIKSIKIGRQIRICKSDVIKFLQSTSQPATHEKVLSV